MISWLAALLIAAQSPTDVAGSYHTQQMEVGAALELKADGTFLYSLDYGAVSEASEGHWRTDGGSVRLDSDPLSMELMTSIERSDAGFVDEPLAVEDGALVLRRYDTLFTFFRDEQ